MASGCGTVVYYVISPTLSGYASPFTDRGSDAEPVALVYPLDADGCYWY
eukprot:SAG11_NODE_1644_length_4526_cov_1.563813_5_plen_49_part_00